MKRSAVFLFIVLSACARAAVVIPPPPPVIATPAKIPAAIPTPVHSVYAEKLIQRLSPDFPKPELETIFSDPRTVAKLIPVTPGKSDLYSEASIHRGLLFMSTYRDVFEYARVKYGASPYFIAARFRAETNFGTYMGKNLVVTALYWLYVLSDDERGQKNAVNRLSTFIRICDQNENEMDIFDIKGSLAGAFGLPQFMPFLYAQLLRSPDRKYVDWDHDGKIDLSKPPEAILAVAWVDYMNGWAERAAKEKRAIYLYNHDWTYVRMVMRYAALLKQTACNDNMFLDPSCNKHLYRMKHRIHHTYR